MTRRQPMPAWERERTELLAEIHRLTENQRDANVLARQLADALGERDTAIEEAEKAKADLRQHLNDHDSEIVTLEMKLEDLTEILKARARA